MSHNSFGDLQDFHDPNLYLTIRGKEYKIDQPNASEGLRIRQLFDLAIINDDTEVENIAAILGAVWVPNLIDVPLLDPQTGKQLVDDKGNDIAEKIDRGTWSGGVWSQMDADGVTWEEMMHAGRTALIDVGMGRVMAETHWRVGMLPAKDAEASGNPLPVKPEPNRAARRATPAKKTAAKKAPAKRAAKKAPAKKA